jgi:hypothetical protein
MTMQLCNVKAQPNPRRLLHPSQVGQPVVMLGCLLSFVVGCSFFSQPMLPNRLHQDTLAPCALTFSWW